MKKLMKKNEQSNTLNRRARRHYFAGALTMLAMFVSAIFIKLYNLIVDKTNSLFYNSSRLNCLRWKMKTFSLAIYSYILKYYNSLFDDLIKKYKISQIEIDILAFLANNPEYHYAQEIVDVRGISKAHVSIAVEKLVKRGFLNRETDPKPLP